MFGILGPLKVHVSGTDVEVSAAKQRAVLALLLIHPNLTVRIDELIDELWPDRPPSSAVANIRTYVVGVRRVLGHDRRRLHTRPSGYRLEVLDDELDVIAFRKHARAGHESLRDRDLDNAERHLRLGLGLWRGQPLEDVPRSRRLASFASAIDEQRAAATEDLARVQLALGCRAEAITEMRQLLLRYPLRESSWLLLMTALHEIGDAAGALAVYVQARRALVDAVGAEPGPDLRRLHKEILAGSQPGPPVPAGAEMVLAHRPGAPRELPAGPQPFVGRRSELLLLREVLRPRTDIAPDGLPAGPTVVVIHGPAGIGKSALAVCAAHLSAGHYPDGQLYLDLQGASTGLPPVDPTEAAGRLLRALGQPDRSVGRDPAEASARLRTTLAQRRMLLLLDNALATAQVRGLIPANPRCAVVLTSRDRLATLDGTLHVPLDYLSGPESARLLSALVGADCVAREPAAAETITRLCGGLPLAIRVAGGRLSGEPAGSVSAFARRLAQERHRLDELGFADLDVRSAFEAGYRHLVSGSRDDRRAARLFRSLALLNWLQFGIDDATALLEIAEGEAGRCLDELVNNGLLLRSRTAYQLHDLLRLYAKELLAQHRTPSVDTAALCRVADRYALIAAHVCAIHRPTSAPTLSQTRPAPATTPRTLPDAIAWLEQHSTKLVALCRQLAASADCRDRCAELAQAVYPTLAIRQPMEWVRLVSAAIHAAEQTSNRKFLAWALPRLAAAYNDLGSVAEAARSLKRALEITCADDDPIEHATTTQVYATTLVRSGQPDTALIYFNTSMNAFVRAKRWPHLGTCLMNAAEALYRMGHAEDCLSLLRHSLIIRRRFGDRVGQAVTLTNIAATHYTLGQMPAALRMSAIAAAMSGEMGNIESQVEALHIRGEALLGVGRAAEAVRTAEQSIGLCQQVENAALEQQARDQLATFRKAAGDPRGCVGQLNGSSEPPRPPSR